MGVEHLCRSETFKNESLVWKDRRWGAGWAKYDGMSGHDHDEALPGNLLRELLVVLLVSVATLEVNDHWEGVDRVFTILLLDDGIVDVSSVTAAFENNLSDADFLQGTKAPSLLMMS